MVKPLSTSLQGRQNCAEMKQQEKNEVKTDKHHEQRGVKEES